MSSATGTYVLVMRSDICTGTQVGRWGMLEIQPGYYIYIGSAFGPGGVSARVARHLRKDKRRHWHIDYLRERVHVHAAWFSTEPERLEHRWAKAVGALPGIMPVNGFGCSDCKCTAHLFYTAEEPLFGVFDKALEGRMQQWQHL